MPEKENQETEEKKDEKKTKNENCSGASSNPPNVKITVEFRYPNDP